MGFPPGFGRETIHIIKQFAPPFKIHLGSVHPWSGKPGMPDDILASSILQPVSVAAHPDRDASLDEVDQFV